MNKCRISSDKINAHLPCRLFKRQGEFHGVTAFCGGGDNGNRRYGYTPVYYGDSVFRFYFFAYGNEVLRFCYDLAVNIFGGDINIGINTVEQGYAHCNGADIKMLFFNHCYSFENIFCVKHAHFTTPQILCIELKISSCITLITSPLSLPLSLMASENSPN